MSVLLRLCFGLVLLAPALVHAATLENPAEGSFYSGIGVISGWKCTANGLLTVRFSDGDPIPLAYGNVRADVRNAGACRSAQVGFVSIMNWAELGDGTHTAVAYDDGGSDAGGSGGGLCGQNPHDVCTDIWTGDPADVQSASICQSACAYATACHEEGVRINCANLRRLDELNNTNYGIRNCSVCQ